MNERNEDRDRTRDIFVPGYLAPASASLTGARLKLSRAESHLQDILKVTRCFSRAKCEIVADDHSEPELIKLVVRLQDPPVDLAVKVGDFLFNIRSMLDHIIWQLAYANGKEPLERSSAFPVCETPEKFLNAIERRMVDGISSQAQSVVENLQPYSGRINPLLTMNNLHNIDKHRTLNVCALVASSNVVRMKPGGQFLKHFPLEVWRLHNGAEFGRVVISQNPGLAERVRRVHLIGEAETYVAFADEFDDFLDELHVDATLQDVFDFAAKTVLPAFNSFFT